MRVGYVRVSKADGSQTLELQRDALLAAGVLVAHLYDDPPLQRLRGHEQKRDMPRRRGRASWEWKSGLLDQVFRFLLGVVGLQVG